MRVTFYIPCTNCSSLLCLHLATASSMPWLSVMKHSVREQLNNFNFFYLESSTSRSPDAEQLARVSSRLYALLLPLCLCVLAYFYGVTQPSMSNTIFSPSLADYEKLEAAYPGIISCRCQFISIPFWKFSSVNLSVHQVSHFDEAYSIEVTCIYARVNILSSLTLVTGTLPSILGVFK